MVHLQCATSLLIHKWYRFENKRLFKRPDVARFHLIPSSSRDEDDASRIGSIERIKVESHATPIVSRIKREALF